MFDSYNWSALRALKDVIDLSAAAIADKTPNLLLNNVC